MTRSRKFVWIMLALFALLMASGLGGFSVAPVALAQSSTSYDLGCWGVFVGGDTRHSPTYTLRDSVGQWTAGTATSPTAIVRAGSVQNWAALYATPAVASTAVEPTTVEPKVAASEAVKSAAFQLHLPIIARHIRVIRTCTW